MNFWPRRHSAGSRSASIDRAVLHRAGRIAALQVAAALGAVLLVVGLAFYLVDDHVQQQQIASQLSAVASAVDDVNDPPPGMALAIRTTKGSVAVSAHAPASAATLLDGPLGYTDLHDGDVEYRGLVTDNASGRVVALLDLGPFDTGRHRLLLALAFAKVVGIATSAGVVLLLSRRSIQPLARALELQRRFVADASHELRAPLTVLHTRVQLLARRADRYTPGELRCHLDGVVAETRALGEVVEELLLSASLESGAQPHEFVDMLALATQVRDSMSAYAESLGIAVDVERGGLEDRSSVVTGSRSALRRALVSLVDNALTHERPGGRVLLRVGAVGSDVVVSVVDTGVGVDSAIAETLFTRFAHGVRRPAGGRRYGIGLALVREVARAHGGDVSVEARPGGGAIFSLRIPSTDNDVC